MTKLRMGIIGTGMAFEKLHYPAYEMLIDKYKIVALCDLDPVKTEKWIRRLQLGDEDAYTDYRAMMKRPDIDAFDIMVPIELNYEVTRDVAEAGKPILCEKPLGANLEQIEAAEGLPAKFHVPIMIAENYRYNEEVRLIADMVNQGRIGDIHYFLWNRFLDMPKDMLTARFSAREWRQHPEFPGGIILDTGVHDMAALRHIFKEVKCISAFGKGQGEDFAPFSAMTANLAFENGVVGNYTFYSAGKEELKPLTGLRIFGTNGMLYLEERDCGTIKVVNSGGKTEDVAYKPQRGYYNELLNFYNAVMGTEEMLVTPEVEFGDALLILGMIKSARENRLIDLEEIRRDKTPAPIA